MPPFSLNRLVVRGFAALAALSALGGVGTETGRYIARAAWEEGKILVRRRNIDELVGDSTTAPDLAHRLGLVRDARTFAVAHLGLNAGASFTTYSALDRDTLVLVLTAARRDTLALRRWWFPVVGSFPYRGFFDFARAELLAAQLRREGFDTYLRPASAFSTLGWFNDPLLSTTVNADTVSLVGTVIHELVHNSIFVKGAVEFNESLASFIGARGAAEFFRSRGATRAARLAELDWEDDKLLGTFWEATERAVDSTLTVAGTSAGTRVSARDSTYARMRAVLRTEIAPRLRTVDTARLAKIQLDNASLLARRTYATGLYLFDEVHRHVAGGASLRETVALIAKVTRGRDDPEQALVEWLGRGK